MSVKTLDLEQTSLGIELGSTRIKAVLIGEDYRSLASGEYGWENQLEEGMWTYHLEDVWIGLQSVFKQVSNAVKDRYGVGLTKVGAMGFSAMMHGYLPFDSKGKQLASFRTWRNTSTEKAAEELTELFQFNIPQRWSIAHLYQAILNGEKHVEDIDFLTTLAGYVHWKLTGKKILGIGEASGMFPIDSDTGNYNTHMIGKFHELIKQYHYNWSLKNILPTVQPAGVTAGKLTEEGARLLDPTGSLQAGIPLCPPEGDAGTGMVATNSVAEHTGNVSAGTSIFAMIVLEKGLSDYYREIDLVTTPAGKPVAMVHCNNFTSDLNAWISLFAELVETIGAKVDMNKLFTVLFQKAMEADADVGGLVNCNYYSGEPITGLEEGRPLFARMPDSKFTLANFMRSQIYSALATLKIGMDLLTTEEEVKIDRLLGHGGFFKTMIVGQQMMADVLDIPVSVMRTASEGGPWGMAILAAYALQKQAGQSLDQYLEEEVFAKETIQTREPNEEGVDSFHHFMKRYRSMLKVEEKAVYSLR